MKRRDVPHLGVGTGAVIFSGSGRFYITSCPAHHAHPLTLAPNGVTANAIEPGYMATKRTERMREDPEPSRQTLERLPAGRCGRPEDIGGTAVCLRSPAVRYVTGAVLDVDRGWPAR